METNKEFVRKVVREKKRALTCEEIDFKSQVIIERLCQCEHYINANRIYAYVNYNQEINMSFLFEKTWANDKKIFVPRVKGQEMEFCRINSMDDLEKGAYGIMEPKITCEMDDEYAGVMIMPGLAFDKMHHRIGYGGGFYDRYLNEHPDFVKIAMCYDFQVFEEIESEEFDIPVDLVISESEIF